MNRRKFLAMFAGATAAWALDPLLRRAARAAQASGRYAIFCYFEGGWDILLSLDPRDPAEFPDSAAEETGIEPGYGLIPADFPHSILDAGPFVLGPCAHELAKVTDHIALVRGINMGTLTHEVGRRYFITGRPPAGTQARGPSAAVRAAAFLGDATPLPNVALGVETYSDGMPSYASALSVASVGTMPYLLRQTLGLPTYVPPSARKALAAWWAAGDPSCDAMGPAGATDAAATYRRNRQRALAIVDAGLYEQFLFDSPALASVRQHYGFTPGNVESPAGRAAFAAQCIKTGLSHVISVVLSTGLDTHGANWATQQPAAQRAGLDAFVRLVEDLANSPHPEGGTYLDRTTLFAFSEFARTPRLNARGGRDHHLASAAILAGGGIRGAALFGATSNVSMGAELVDLSTGAPTADGATLRPEYVVSTALAALGLDASEPLRAAPLAPLLA